MYKVSEVNADDVVKALLENELGFLLIQSDNDCKNMYDVLLEKSTYEDRLGMFGYNTHITYCLFPLMYYKSNKAESDIVKARANALYNIFARWTDKGYNKRHAIEDIARALGIDAVPIVFEGTLDEAVAYVKTCPQSTIGTAPMEGIVCKPIVDVLTRNKERVIVKIKVKDFV